jgi:hypothetical protein
MRRPAASVAGTQERARKLGTRSALYRGGEDVVAGPLRGGKMCLQLMDDEGRQPAGSPHSAELGRDGEHSWTKAVQQVILRHGDASSQLDLAVSA